MRFSLPLSLNHWLGEERTKENNKRKMDQITSRLASVAVEAHVGHAPLLKRSGWTDLRDLRPLTPMMLHVRRTCRSLLQSSAIQRIGNLKVFYLSLVEFVFKNLFASTSFG
ncbi:hypothetical protein F2P56_035061 [Juglans regia]|uniref:Uncharacterized protein n=1 Tax=Juglans regia TaxID=51240 RepID=A0A833WS02_JUGRE|nr:hypothetical protein F2P56_035061 [Juglans regia]